MNYKLECRNTGAALELRDGNSYVVGRSHDVDMPIEDSSFSRKQFRLLVSNGRCTIEPMSSDNPTFLNGSRIHEQIGICEPCEIVAGNVFFVLLSDNADGGAGPKSPTILLQRNGVTHPTTISDEFRLGEQRYVFGRDPKEAQILLNNASISRQHAELFRTDFGYSIRDLNSSNSTYVDGQAVGNEPIHLAAGCLIEIGPFSIRFDGTSLHPLADSKARVGLVANHLSRRIPHGTRRAGSKTLLNDISLCFLPGEFVAILGPSGSGKSTLLRALCNRESATLQKNGTGEISVNQKNIHRQFEQVKQQLAYVPQEDVLHEYLSVDEALMFAGKLRLPPDADRDELQRRIGEVLDTVSLEQHRRTKIGKLSGGQKKRAILAAEVLAEPNLFFLDEVTSGLDEIKDREIMQLMHKIANEGKTILCVTHNTSNILEFCSLVVVLGEGGNLKFVGAPDEALNFFDIEKFADIYNSVDTDVLIPGSRRPLRREFVNSEFWKTYVSDRIKSQIPTTNLERFQEKSRTLNFHSFVEQLPILTRRSFKLLISDRLGTRSWIFQVVLVAVLLIWVFGDVSNPESFAQGRQARLGFFLVLSAFWFGCNNAARQIVREQNVFLHERDVGLSSAAFYVSKLIPLAFASFVQSTLVFFTAIYGCGLPGSVIHYLAVAGANALAGTSLGLCISCWSRTDEVAIGFVPIVLIPQLLLANCLVSLDGWAENVAQFAITSFWGFKAQTCILESEAIGETTQQSLTLSIGIILVHALLLNVCGLWRLNLKRRS